MINKKHLLQRKWLLRFAGLVLGSQLIGGCVSISNAPEPSKAVADKNEGYVVVSVTGNTGQVGQIESIQLQLQNRRQDQPEKIEVLHNVAACLARDTALFIGILPEGDYAFDQFNVGTIYVPFGDGAKKLIGNIHVTAGKVADLGRIVMTPINSFLLMGRSELITSNTGLVKRFSPSNAAIYDHEVTNGWINPRSEHDRVEEYAMDRPVGADTPAELKDGSVIAASRLGTLLIRNHNGRWRAVRTGDLNSLLAVTPVLSGDVDGVNALAVAVGEFNTIVRLDTGGKLSTLDSGNLPPGNLLYVAGNSSAGWYVADQEKDKVTLYHSMKLDHGDWAPMRVENMAFSFWSGANSFWMWRTQHGFSYAISQGIIRSYDFATDKWSEAHAPNNDRLITIAPSEKGLGILTSPGGGFGGMFAHMYVSYDDGATWQVVQSPYKVKMYAPRVLADGALLVAGGGPFSLSELQRSLDQGKTWTICSNKFGIEANLMPLPTQGLLGVEAGAQFGYAAIWHSSDDGSTWSVEYSNFDRQAYELQKKKH